MNSNDQNLDQDIFSTDIFSISELFHENTKLHLDTGFLLAPKSDFTRSELRNMAKGYKKYPYAKIISLPGKETWPNGINDFDQVIKERRSVRTFGEKPVSLPELSKILFQTFGISGEIPIPGGGAQYLRTSPSGGALYPAEIYLAIRNVEGLEKGLYHYQVSSHSLEVLELLDPTEKLNEALCGQEYCEQASIVFLISGFIARTKYKYGERGYRYVLLDIGHLGQNLYLSCAALNFGIMTTCGFFDDLVNKFLKIDGTSEAMMYAAFVGKQ
ncbi:MAG: SagB/ThcOx family dehydrogenase [Candidatus Nitronauta litoralis]|uniref:SagB/ThcOx family dehydrogenase n=1 Tax=Candidatus Nitronauta litoralis TaxID=2705533 RepID=A0A7T0FYN3_9BACT|nr:MAG: SagB/ThcOx family dehydrogenase [Candidatus Nitronauta litoralis]